MARPSVDPLLNAGCEGAAASCGGIGGNINANSPTFTPAANGQTCADCFDGASGHAAVTPATPSRQPHGPPRSGPVSCGISCTARDRTRRMPGRQPPHRPLADESRSPSTGVSAIPRANRARSIRDQQDHTRDASRGDLRSAVVLPSR